MAAARRRGASGGAPTAAHGSQEGAKIRDLTAPLAILLLVCSAATNAPCNNPAEGSSTLLPSSPPKRDLAKP
jgi:hypothetical protein